MKRKHLIILTSGIMAVLMLFSGCAGTKTSVDHDKKTLSYWVGFDVSASSKLSSMNDVEMYKQREKDSGIHIDFIHPPSGQEKEQFNLMIAARDFPDIIEYGWMTGYPGGPTKAIQDDIIIPINQYMDKHALNFKNRLETGEYADTYRKASLSDEGDYYGFPEFCVGNIRIFAGLYLRKDWLDELGLTVPETIDEWTAVLRAFKNIKGVKSPLTGTISYLTNGDVYHSFNGAYNVGRELYLDGNTVKYAPLEPGYKDYLKLLSDWYREELLDNDYPTNTAEIVRSKMVTGASGVTYGFTGSGIGSLLSAVTDDPKFDLVAATPPTLNKGDKVRFAYAYTDVRNKALCITTTCETPETAVEWADFWYSDEGLKLLNFGIEGYSYNMVDGHAVYTDLILNNPEGLDINTALAITLRGQSSAPGLMQHPDYLAGRYSLQQQKDAFATWQQNTEEARKITLPIVVPNDNESKELATLSNDLKTYLDEMMLKFIQGIESFDNYDKFVNKLKTEFQAERYVEIYQDMYNRYLAR